MIDSKGIFIECKKCGKSNHTENLDWEFVRNASNYVTKIKIMCPNPECMGGIVLMDNSDRQTGGVDRHGNNLPIPEKEKTENV